MGGFVCSRIILAIVISFFLATALFAEEGGPHEPTGPIALHDAESLARTRSPELRALSLEIRAKEAVLLQADFRSNPTLNADMQDIDSSNRQTNLLLGQLIEMGDKRTQRRHLAALERDLALWDYEAKQIELMAQTDQAFFSLLSAQEQVELLGELAQLAQQVALTVAERVKAGKVSPIEETKTQIALSSARIEMDRAGRDVEVARKRLTSMWGGATPLFTRATGEMGPLSAIPPLSALVLRLPHHPELARWDTEMLRRRTAVDLEKSKVVPDLTITGGIRWYQASDDPTYVTGLSFPLPIFNVNQGGIEEAQTRLVQGEEEKRAAELRMSTALDTAYQSLLSAHAEVTALRDTILPAAQSAFDATNEGYRLGKFGLLDLLDAQRTLFGMKAQYLRVRTDAQQAVAEVERLIGGRLNKIQEEGEIQ